MNRKYVDLDCRTQEVSRKVVAYANCMAIYMDISFTKGLSSMAKYAQSTVEEKIAMTQHLIVLIDNALKVIERNQAQWIEDEKRVGDKTKNLSLNPNVQTFSIVNLTDNSIPTLLSKLRKEYEDSLYESVHEFVSMNKFEQELKELLHSGDFMDDEEEQVRHFKNITQDYYSYDTYQQNMTDAQSNVSSEEIETEFASLVDKIYSENKKQCESYVEINYEQVPYPLNVILSKLETMPQKA